MTRFQVLLDLQQLVSNIEHRLVAAVQVFSQAAQNQSLEIARQVGHDLPWRRRLRPQYGLECFDGRLAFEWARAGGHLIQRCAKAEDVAARIDLAADRLFRGHVRRGARGAAGSTHAFATQIGDGRGPRVLFIDLRQLREAEVEHLDRAVVADHDVARLEITVDDAPRVRRGDRVGRRDRNTEQFARPKTPCWNQRVEARAVDEFHHDEIDIALPVELVNGDDVRVTERGEELRFAQETLAAPLVEGVIRWEDLDCDLARETRVARQINLTHAASGQ